MDIKIYHNSRCSKSREALTLIEREINDFKIIEYLKNPLRFDEIKKIVGKLSIKPIDLLPKTNKHGKINKNK